MKIRIKNILLLLSICAVAGCAQDYKKYDFKKIDGTKNTTVKLEALQGQKGIHAVNIHIIGNIEGTGTISWTAARKSKDISRKVDLTWSNEWYESSCIIDYKPKTVKSGEIIIYYKFENI
jgi:hypothetical protein